MKSTRLPVWYFFVALTVAGSSVSELGAQQAGASRSLATAVTFYASFDNGVKADVAQGDPQLYTVVETKPNEVIRPGLQTGAVTSLAGGGGLGGGALKFTKKDAKRIYYQAQRNLAYRTTGWAGTVSLWLRLDPEEDLEPGFCDPIQITPRKWNDAAFFVDFDKEGDPRDFRLGAFADFAVWNPDNKPLDQIQRPLLPVKNPPFGRDKWTHVAFTWQNFNSGDTAAVATFYLDGKRQGSISDWKQQFTWTSDEQSRIQIGINYIGLFDDLTCFHRALTDAEVGQLYQLRGGWSKVVNSARR